MSDSILIASTILVRENGDRFKVSTINRDSSAALAYGHRYAETMAFKLVKLDGVEKQTIIGQGEASEHSLHEHLRAMRCIYEHGTYELREED